jgi:hypothetical protein
MEHADLEFACSTTLSAMNWTLDDASKLPELYHRVVSAVLEGIRAERKRLAHWIVEDTHSMICRGTARELQEAIRGME